MPCGFVITRLSRWMSVNLINSSVTYVSGTFVTLDTGLNTYKGGGLLNHQLYFSALLNSEEPNV